MRINSERMQSAVVQFIRDDILPNFSQGPVKLMLSVVSAAMQKDPEMLHRLIDSYPAVNALLMWDGSTYDPELFLSALRDGMSESGGLVVTIPRIPLIMPAECRITLDTADLERLRSRLA